MIDDQPFEPIDALGKNIIFGRCYGYTSTKSGYARTVIGEAEKLTKSGLVTLKIIEVKNFLYGRSFEKTWGDEASHVNMRPHMLFPIGEPT